MSNSTNADLAAFLLRVSLGVMALAHGLVLKVMTFGVPGTVGFFGSLGYPPVVTYLVLLGEIGGGVLLILGIASRWVALAQIPILIGATLVHLGNGWVFSGANGGWEFPAFWTVALLVQALLGDGAYSLGARLASKFNLPILSSSAARA